MKISNINNSLDGISNDEKVGVKLALLTGDESMSVFAIELRKGEFIPAHYHKKGIETYFILNGHGVVSLGKTNNKSTIWESERQVNSGDCFTVFPNEVHTFKNVSQEILRIIATTSLSHNRDDRYFVGE